MRINKKSLENVLKTIALFGVECELVRKSNQLIIEGFDLSFSKGYKYVHVVEDSTELVEASVNVSQLQAAIKGKQKTVDLTLNSEFLTVLNGKRKTKLRLKEPEYAQKKKFPNLVLKAKYAVELTDVREVLTVTKGIITGNFNIQFEGTENLLLRANDDLNVTEEVVEGECRGEPATSKYSHANLWAVFQGTGKALLSFDNNYPLHVWQQDEDWYVEYLVAPVVDNK